jgi:hypothetical protein
MGLVCLARAVRPRWRPLLAGAVLTAVGLTWRSGPVSVAFIPGALLLLGTPLVEAARDEGVRGAEVSPELAGYPRPAQKGTIPGTRTY